LAVSLLAPLSARADKFIGKVMKVAILRDDHGGNAGIAIAVQKKGQTDLTALHLAKAQTTPELELLLGSLRGQKAIFIVTRLDKSNHREMVEGVRECVGDCEESAPEGAAEGAKGEAPAGDKAPADAPK
jgi:hypothetical protein